MKSPLHCHQDAAAWEVGEDSQRLTLYFLPQESGDRGDSAGEKAGGSVLKHS